LVDVWAICDQNNLDWIRSHQSSLYRGLEDALIREDVDVASLGGRFIYQVASLVDRSLWQSYIKIQWQLYVIIFFQNCLIFNISRSLERSQKYNEYIIQKVHAFQQLKDSNTFEAVHSEYRLN
jgi:hypothetical protein